MHCTLCNEWIEPVELQFGDAYVIEGEYWHKECFSEYFEGVDLSDHERVLEEA